MNVQMSAFLSYCTTYDEALLKCLGTRSDLLT